MRTIQLCLFAALLLVGCSGEKYLMRKAAIAVDRCDYESALRYYDKALARDTGSYFANAGKGVVLSEYMEKQEDAIPYLEKALSKAPEKTAFRLNYDLGKSFHKIGSFKRAITYYERAAKYNTKDNPDYDAYLAKRIEDCNYALAHKDVAPSQLQLVTNVGRPINTKLPEYGPVFTGGRLLYTSEKKDGPGERINGTNGRYFESIYLSYLEDEKFTEPRRFTIPDNRENSKFQKGNESILSASADGKKLFIYRSGKIYEADVRDTGYKVKRLDKNINISYFQSHACVSADCKTLYFTAEDDDDGVGGTDIYYSQKDKKGNWSKPAPVAGINTVYNEDSPYYSSDGTLFFSSNGLPGYGGYDVYRTHLENGLWTKPENLGQPINSPGDELYFALKPGGSSGYYASSRVGGAGDMDIYKVHYTSPVIPPCQTVNDSIVAINVVHDPVKALTYQLSIVVPTEYEKNQKSYVWKINDEILTETVKDIDYTFDKPGTYTVGVKVVVYCDTCASLIALCSEKPVAAEINIAKKDSNPEVFLSAKIQEPGLKKSDEELGAETLKSLGWNATNIYFDLNKYDLKEQGKAILEANIKILKNNRHLIISIHGYTDSRGHWKYNKILAAKRVKAIQNYLHKNGIASNRILATYSLGEEGLVNHCNDDAECDEALHQLNRRAEMKVYSRQKKVITALNE